MLAYHQVKCQDEIENGIYKRVSDTKSSFNESFKKNDTIDQYSFDFLT